MVGPILLLVMVTWITLLIAQKDKNDWASTTAFSVGFLGSFILLGLTAGIAGSGYSTHDGLKGSRNIQEAKIVSFTPAQNDNDKHVFVLEDGTVVKTSEKDTKFETSGEESSIRYGNINMSWGHWLPFDDWESEKTFVEYTPGA